MSKSHTPYPEAFRANAVALVRRSGKTIAEAVADLGVSDESLRKWVQQAKVDAGEGLPGALSSEERKELRRLQRENKTLQVGREILKKPRPSSRGRRSRPHAVHWCGEGPVPDHHAVPARRRLRAGYYAWARRSLSARAQADAALTDAIRAIHSKCRQTYRVPRVHAELHDQGHQVSRKCVARLMRLAGVRGCGRRRRVRTMVSDAQATPAPNSVDRHFSVGAVNRLWITDLTYLWTAEGWLYVAAMLDAHSRRVIGWAMGHPRTSGDLRGNPMADRMRVDLAMDALEIALRERRPRRGDLVHHRDRGRQYTAGAYPAVLAARGIRCSMSRKGDCWDNTMADRFFATLKRELMTEEGRLTKEDTRAAVFDWIADYDNRQRRHSSIEYRTPVDFETSKERSQAA